MKILKLLFTKTRAATLLIGAPSLVLGSCQNVCAQAQPTISTPSSPYSNSYTSPQVVTLSAASGTIYYTLDGTDPTNASTAYSTPFTISSPTHVKAISYLAGNYSAPSSMFIDVDASLAPILQPGLLLRLRADFGVTTGIGNPPIVSTWEDLSGNNNGATGASSNEPKWMSDSINCRPTVAFNGSSEHLTLPSGFADFTKTLIKITNGPPYALGTQRITVNGNNADYSASIIDTNATIASGLSSAINALALSGISATASDNLITVTAPAATTITATPVKSILIDVQNCGLSVFVVTSPSSLSADARIIDLSRGSNGDNLNLQISSSGSKGQLSIYNGNSGSNAQSASGLAQSKFQVLSGVQVPGTSNGTATVYIDGTAGTPNASMNNIPNTNRTDNLIGKGFAGNYFPGRIAEVLVYSNRLSASEMSAVTAYLSQKYQLNSQAALAPVFSMDGSALSAPAQVQIKAQAGAKTFITTDGSTPSSSSEPFNGDPITINYTQTIKAISILNGIESPISSATFTLDSSQWPAPSPGDVTAPTINLIVPIESN